MENEQLENPSVAFGNRSYLEMSIRNITTGTMIMENLCLFPKSFS